MNPDSGELPRPPIIRKKIYRRELGGAALALTGAAAAGKLTALGLRYLDDNAGRLVAGAIEQDFIVDALIDTASLLLTREAMQKAKVLQQIDLSANPEK